MRDLLQNIANLGIQIAIKIQTKGAWCNRLVWTVTQSFPPKGVQPMSGTALRLGNMYRKLTALLLDSGVMQQCLLTNKHVILMRTVPFEF